MNAAQHDNHPQDESPSRPGDSRRGMEFDWALSALADGETGSSELDLVLGQDDGRAEVLSSWHTYHVIGDVLRGKTDPVGPKPANEFIAAVRAGLLAQHAQAIGTGGQVAVSTTPVAAVRAEAANDAVFRWKLVAGLASLAAVMAVSWNVLLGTGVGVDGDVSTRGQLAQSQQDESTASASTPLPAGGAVADRTAVVPMAVATGQGILIRDAQLEALMAEHRQHGGMSALQMPTGFIRNATYDAAGR